MQGKVVSTKMNKTVVIEVERLVEHPIYKKRIKKTKRFLSHDDLGVKEGDFVEIKETRPLSKNKKFIVTKTLSKVEIGKSKEK